MYLSFYIVTMQIEAFVIFLTPILIHPLQRIHAPANWTTAGRLFFISSSNLWPGRNFFRCKVISQESDDSLPLSFCATYCTNNKNINKIIADIHVQQKKEKNKYMSNEKWRSTTFPVPFDTKPNNVKSNNNIQEAYKMSVSARWELGQRSWDRGTHAFSLMNETHRRTSHHFWQSRIRSFLGQTTHPYGC